VSDDKVIVTEDRAIREGGVLHENDKQLANPKGAVQITSVEQLQAMAEAAHKKYLNYQLMIGMKMEFHDAFFVRSLRLDGHSWRSIAAEVHKQWGPFKAHWSPPSNQIAGIVLCEKAAHYLGEDAKKEPWN
jgi:hypothetical protein